MNRAKTQNTLQLQSVKILEVVFKARLKSIKNVFKYIKVKHSN